MKVNYQERIDLSVGELKIILSEQRTITNRVHLTFANVSQKS
jgi:putative transposase